MRYNKVKELNYKFEEEKEFVLKEYKKYLDNIYKKLKSYYKNKRYVCFISKHEKMLDDIPVVTLPPFFIISGDKVMVYPVTLHLRRFKKIDIKLTTKEFCEYILNDIKQMYIDGVMDNYRRGYYLIN